MRILVLANNDVGLYKFRKELLQELICRGNRVYAALPNGEFVPEIVGLGVEFINVPVDRRGINPIKDVGLIMRYIMVLNKVVPDLVITYTIKPNIYGGAVCRFMKRRYALNITGLGTAFQNDGFIKRLVQKMYRFSAKKAKVVFFENEENKKIFLENNLIRPEQACRLNGAGVNLEDYPYTEYPDEIQPVRFLFIGRVMAEKGVNELFAVARRIKEKYPKVVFDIVGPMEDEYESQIKGLEDAGVICYHGYQRDVKPFIARCHCFVLPSWHEGMANTLLEAAAMGRPLITSRIHGCMEAVEEGITGLLCKKKDVDSLYEVMKEFCGYSYDRRKEMGKMGRKRMERLFDKEKVVFKTMGHL